MSFHFSYFHYAAQRKYFSFSIKSIFFLFLLTDINECDSAPCQNGGTCKESIFYGLPVSKFS